MFDLLKEDLLLWKGRDQEALISRGGFDGGGGDFGGDGASSDF